MLEKLTSQKIKPEVVEILINQCREIILSRVSPVAVYLFGSAARSQIPTASDLDIAIVIES